MNFLRQRANVEILPISGMLRVIVRPPARFVPMLFQAALIVAFAFLCFWSGARMSRGERLASEAFVVLAIAGWVQQLLGFSEIIEFDAQYLRIHNEIFGWHRTKEYPLEQCTDLEIQDMSGRPHGLQCRIGWRTLEFGDHMSHEQATEVIRLLQETLPDVAKKILPSLDITRQLTTLGLS